MVKITKGMQKALGLSEYGALPAEFIYRKKTYILRYCLGEAHNNPNIDHCMRCAPLWGICVTEGK